MTYRAGTASISPLVGDRVLVWSWQEVQPGDSLTVRYQVEVTGEPGAATIPPIRSVISYSLPDGQWVTNPAVPGTSVKIAGEEGER